jgi:hypothetical protein
MGQGVAARRPGEETFAIIQARDESNLDRHGSKEEKYSQIPEMF